MSKFTADTMKKAWAIRRAAAAKFGCRVSEVSWKECLHMAAVEKSLPERLLLKGGKEWVSGDKRRIYMNGLAGLYGIEYSTFESSGRVSVARIDGEKISNSAATMLLGALKTSKVWYDYADQQIHYSITGCKFYSAEGMKTRIATAIEAI